MGPRNYKSLGYLIAWIAALSMTASQAAAGGFTLQGHSADGVGVAQAGSVCGYDDGSAAFFNPAALTSIQTPMVTVGNHLLPLHFDFSDKGSNVMGMPNQGPDDGERNVPGDVPNFYAVKPFNEDTVGALFLTTPFGLATRYDKEWVGRYQAVNSELSVVQMGAAVGYDLLDNLSIGGSLSALYSQAKLTNAVDFGTVGNALLGPQTAAALGLAPQQNDGYMRMDGHDWGMGWQVGTNYRYDSSDPRNSIGLTYRSKTKVHLGGDDATFDVPLAAMPLTSTGAFTTSNANADITLPESVAFGATHWVAPEWELLYESAWTRWDRMEKVEVKFDNPAQPAVVETMNWENTLRHAVGVRYQPEKDWNVRVGFQYDRSPVRGAENRSARVPDSDQYWATIGASYSFSEHLRMDLSYAHVWLASSSTNRTGATGDVLIGDWENSFDAISTALVYAF